MAAVGQNPFVEPQPHVNEYSAQQIATLQNRLEKQLGPEYISSRPGAGGNKVHFITAEKCIQLANEVFGFNGWSTCIKDTTVDFVSNGTNISRTWLTTKRLKKVLVPVKSASAYRL